MFHIIAGVQFFWGSALAEANPNRSLAQIGEFQPMLRPVAFAWPVFRLRPSLLEFIVNTAGLP